MANESIVKATGIYNGHSIRNNMNVELKVRFNENELANAITFIAGIGKRLRVLAKFKDQETDAEKKVKLGSFNINRISIDRNGNCFLSLMSSREYVFVDNINEILSDETEITFIAQIESED